MKIIKDKNIIINIDLLPSQIQLKEDNYILLENEEDITKYEYIELLYNSFGSIDYKMRRRLYKYLSINFNNLDNITKNMICKLCAMTANNIIGYYIYTLGMTIQDAQYKYLTDRSVDIIESAKCCEAYIMSPKFIKTILLYLPIVEAEKFLDDIRELSYKYRDAGHFGKKYGDKTDGILDYIESYGTFENGGLKNYTLNTGMSLTNFINDLLDILYLGNID